MKRIGFAASKISKGSLLLYNFYVIIISILLSSFIFIIAGSTVVFALVIISYLVQEIMPSGMQKDWTSIQYICMITLTIVVVIFNMFAISANIKFTKTEKDL